MVAKSNGDSYLLLIAVSIVLTLGLLILPSFLLPLPELISREAPLGSTVPLPFRGGETFTYEFRSADPSLGETASNISYQTGYVRESPLTDAKCVYFLSPTDSFCVEDGGLLSFNGTALNQSYLFDGFYIYQPWMLAVGENWNWNASIGLNLYQNAMRTITFKSLDIENVNGRPAFKVQITDAYINSSSIVYIDKKWRILSSVNSTTSAINLVSVKTNYR
ncbi:hypothetical protein COT30_01870 [Candidatus Micrarchaeota archaeon CG08_land_8_20_14_0_20_49_17]|nr:MAG: hypothetical protein AUJ13_01185 [Candidatus Micrarchaeota archaeon CG1_02_49_24]PIU09932.1 MAG: hypothetical protein COT30_01870 [Candidatus Micrarchaeota archaeon CG08_land_8_20_14_0_20_49_17]PIU82380.1 MAG: hypothetical protein COS70_01610 [Candidatus Micrarchaeota archaeon CG06_land_8_20_14_3_00_50_6]PIZ96047.1 MAG: hypothetical protein COX84_04100 [Candidatus Micrarchaeota archaeon CG_4_10_14_0_2_um_filter_49_7]HII53259.1 hypothetical protein [Candidatus Micrarchaeota archaeon]